MHTTLMTNLELSEYFKEIICLGYSDNSFIPNLVLHLNMRMCLFYRTYIHHAIEGVCVVGGLRRRPYVWRRQHRGLWSAWPCS